MPASINETLIANVRALLKAQSITQAQLAKRSGLPTTSINRVFLGTDQSPRLETVAALAKGFQISIAALLSSDGLNDSPQPTFGPVFTSAKEIGRLVEDYVLCDEAGKNAVLKLAASEARRACAA